MGSIPTSPSCGSLIPFSSANAQWVFHGGSHSTLIYTSELILCSTICVHSATRHNIHMYPHLNSGVRLLLELYRVFVIKHVAFFTIWVKLTMSFTCTNLPFNLYTSVSGGGCDFEFEQKFWRTNEFGKKKARIGGFAYPYSPDSRRRSTNLLFSLFSLFFCPFIFYCCMPNVSSTPSKSHEATKLCEIIKLNTYKESCATFIILWKIY